MVRIYQYDRQATRLVSKHLYDVLYSSAFILATPDDISLSQLAAETDDNLSVNILNNPHQVLHKLLHRQN